LLLNCGDAAALIREVYPLRSCTSISTSIDITITSSTTITTG
jgi:hypothetical protein